MIRGCVPKKLLVYASEFHKGFEDAVGFGWAHVKPPHDWKSLIAHKAQEISRLNGIYKSLLKGAAVDCFEGWGGLLDPHTIEVRLSDGGTKRMTAKHILIATGSYTTKIPIEGAEHAIGSDEALHLDNLPSKNQNILIIGSG